MDSTGHPVYSDQTAEPEPKPWPELDEAALHGLAGDIVKATNAHISIAGHITKDELPARLDDISKANGFANRFLWPLVRRSKELPDGEAVPVSPSAS